MRAILIDPFHKTISDTDYNGDYRHIYELIDCDTFTVVNIVEYKNGNRESIFVDDEGLLKDPTYFFAWRGYDQPLAGKGLILGCDNEGETIGTEVRLEDAKELTSFMKLSVLGMKTEEGQTEIFGKMFHQIRHTPVFGPPKKESQ